MGAIGPREVPPGRLGSERPGSCRASGRFSARLLGGVSGRVVSGRCVVGGLGVLAPCPAEGPEMMMGGGGLAGLSSRGSRPQACRLNSRIAVSPRRLETGVKVFFSMKLGGGKGSDGKSLAFSKIRCFSRSDCLSFWHRNPRFTAPTYNQRLFNIIWSRNHGQRRYTYPSRQDQ